MKTLETINKLLDTVEKVTSFKKCPRYDRHGKEIPPSSGSLEELIESGETNFFQLADAAEDKGKYFFLLGKMYNCCIKFRTKALDALCKAVKLDPDAIEAWNELGECYWYHVNIEMAKQCFERALAKSENKISLRNLSVVVRKQGLSMPTDAEKHKCFEDAADFAKRSVKLDPTDGVSWSILGNAYLALFFGVSSEYQLALQAIAAYKQAEKNLEVIDNFEIFYNKGIVLKYIEHYSDALDTLLKTIESEKTWDLSFNTYNTLLQYLDLIMSYIGHKGRLKPKKFYAMLKGLNTVRVGPYSNFKLIFINNLVDGVNKNCVLFGKVLWSVQMDCSFPFTFGLVDANGDEVVITVFNLSIAHRFFIIGDSVAIPNPWFEKVDSVHKDKCYKFRKVRVENPKELIVNDKHLPESCYAKVKFDTLPMQF
ncbi:tetratricopeptide repeat protein 5 isoform X1 [Halyomorpha halys]|uniref:tetratricopeptide repeat protein 5 isoform X1 n=1 Tax=Halyomorpha halys TaxID=286706 RepID=UPI0006D4EF3E|nr:tetratricopeptide repeat protein 5-like [Halyomorpha halys]